MMITKINHSLPPFQDRSRRVDFGDESLEKIKRRGIVKIGHVNERPFAYFDPYGQHITGESWKIATTILTRMGIQRVEPVQTEFWSLIPKLRNGTYDIIGAGMYITPLRSRDIAFSHPTYKNKEGLIVKKGNPLNLNQFRDILIHPSAKLAVILGSVVADYARLSYLPPSRIISYTDGRQAIQGLMEGEADAFVTSSIRLNNLTPFIPQDRLERRHEFNGIVMNGRPVVEYGAFGFRKEENTFRAEFNRHLKEFLCTPEHRELVIPFGFTEAELPDKIDPEILKLIK